MRVRVRCSLQDRPVLQRVGWLLGSCAPGLRYAACPECGRAAVKKLPKPDRIERVSRAWWSGLQQFFGGALYYCSVCRLQFYDCRKAAESRRSVGTMSSLEEH